MQTRNEKEKKRKKTSMHLIHRNKYGKFFNKEVCVAECNHRLALCYDLSLSKQKLFFVDINDHFFIVEEVHNTVVSLFAPLVGKYIKQSIINDTLTKKDN